MNCTINTGPLEETERNHGLDEDMKAMRGKKVKVYKVDHAERSVIVYVLDKKKRKDNRETYTFDLSDVDEGNWDGGSW